MKRIMLFLLLVALLLPLVSCGAQDQGEGVEIPLGMKPASADSDNYYLFVPEGWFVSRTGDTVLAYASYYDRTTVSLTTLRMTSPSVQAYWEAHEGEFSSLFGDYALTGPAEELQTSEIWDVRYLYTVTYDETAYGGIQYFSLRGDYLYVLTYTAAMGSEGNSPYEKHYEELSRIVDTFLFVTDGEDGSCTPLADLEAFPDEHAPADMKLASNTAISPYRLYIPSDWRIDITEGITCVYDPTTLSAVTVEVETPSANTMAEYWAQVQKDIMLVSSDFTLLSKHTDENGSEVLYDVVECGGQRGYLYDYTLKYLGEDYHCRKVMLLRGSKVYTLSLTAAASAYDAAAADFSTMLREFKFD